MSTGLPLERSSRPVDKLNDDTAAEPDVVVGDQAS
jgi:hypothetical protein